MNQQPVNVVMITCHDLGRFLGCYGISTVRSPNLDRLAAEGVMFTRAWATAPQCSPSRSSIYTGRYPHANGVLGLTHGEFGWDLHPDEVHLAQALGAGGYSTVMIGILHEAREIERCGFDQVYLPGHDARETTDLAIASLRDLAARAEPFYLQIGYHEPHRVPSFTPEDTDYLGFAGSYIEGDTSAGVTVPPYIADDAGARQEMAELQGAVNHLDRAAGGVFEEIRRLGIEDDTLVIFTTDHGLALPRAKCSLYDPGLEVALVMRLPSRGWRGGRVATGLVSNIDLFPTIMELAGQPVDPAVHGRSLVPFLDNESDVFRDRVFGQITYHDYYHPQRAIRTDRHKLIANFTTAPSFMDPSQSWHRRVRPVIPEEPALAYGPPLELYDLEADPNEWENLADDPAERETREHLASMLHRWMQETGDPLLNGAVTPPRHDDVIAELERSAGSGR